MHDFKVYLKCLRGPLKIFISFMKNFYSTIKLDYQEAYL